VTLSVLSFVTGGWANQTIGPLITSEWLEDALAEAEPGRAVGYKLARDQLVSILEGIDQDGLCQPEEGACGFKQARFTNFDEDAAIQTRMFFIRSAARATVSDGLCIGRAWTRHDMDLAIYYRFRLEDASLDEMINTDYEVVRTALLDPRNWNRPGSSIIELATDIDELIPADDEQHIDDDGDVKGVFQIFRIPLTQTEQTA